MVWKIAVCLVTGYLCGTFSTSYIIGRFKHIDIREYGSGNAGTTNAFRTLGKLDGCLTFLGDFLKVVIPLLIMRLWIFRGEDCLGLMQLIFGFGCVIGHNYPVWLRFKGGKGIAVTAGVYASLDPWFTIPGIIVFAGVILISKYVSLGSLVLSVVFPIWLTVFWHGKPYFTAMLIVSLLFTASAFFRHKENIKRLMNGTENKIGQHVQIDVPKDFEERSI